MTAAEITAIVVVGTIILAIPFVGHFFVKEDGCGRTLWQRLFGKNK